MRHFIVVVRGYGAERFLNGAVPLALVRGYRRGCVVVFVCHKWGRDRRGGAGDDGAGDDGLGFRG